MTSARTAAPPRPRSAARLTCLAASALLLVTAALGLTWWNALPQFPPPAANDLLLSLRRAAVLALAVLGLTSLPWVVRPGTLPVLGVGVHVLAVMCAVSAAVALRGESLAALYWLPVVASAAACLAIVWASSRPAPRRT